MDIGRWRRSCVVFMSTSYRPASSLVKENIVDSTQVQQSYPPGRLSRCKLNRLTMVAPSWERGGGARGKSRFTDRGTDLYGLI